MSERTFQGHALEFRRGAQGTIEFGGGTSGGPGDAALRSAPEPEFEPEFEPEGPTQTGDLKSITLSCGDGWTAVAPSYDVTSGSALPIQSEAAPDGESWTFTFISWGEATVETSISCLSYADKALQVLLRSTRLSTVATVPGGDTTKRDTALDCPVGFIGIVGGYSTTADLAVLGQETQAKRRLFWLQNLAGGAQSATVSLLCIGLTTDTTTSLITPAGVSVPPPGVEPESTPHHEPVPGTTPRPRPRPVGRITNRRLRAKRGYVHITIACPKTASCEGRVILSDDLTYLGSAKYAGSGWHHHARAGAPHGGGASRVARGERQRSARGDGDARRWHRGDHHHSPVGGSAPSSSRRRHRAAVRAPRVQRSAESSRIGRRAARAERPRRPARSWPAVQPAHPCRPRH